MTSSENNTSHRPDDVPASNFSLEVTSFLRFRFRRRPRRRGNRWPTNRKTEDCLLSFKILTSSAERMTNEEEEEEEENDDNDDDDDDVDDDDDNDDDDDYKDDEKEDIQKAIHVFRCVLASF